MKIFKNKYFIKLLAILTLLVINQPLSIKAQSNNSTLPFEVSITVPGNQLDSIQSYFNLDLNKGQVQSLNVQLKNKKDTSITVDVKSANALTSPNGGIMYIDKKEIPQSKLTDKSFYMDEHIKGPKKVSLEGNEIKTITIEFIAPTQAGIYLGGLLFQLDGDMNKNYDSNDELNFSVNNKIEYAVAIQANVEMKEGNSEIKLLKSKGTQVEVFPAGPQLHFLLENENADIVRDVKIKYEVFKGESLFYGDLIPFNIAPKSKVGIAIPWKAEEFENGEYTLKVTVIQNQNANVFTEKFQVTASSVRDYAEKTGEFRVLPSIAISPSILMLCAGAILIFILLIIMLFTWNRKKKQKQNESMYY